MTYTNFPNSISVFGTPGVPLFPPGPTISYFGKNVWFVDTVNGSDGYDGRSPSTPFASMGRAFWLDWTANGTSSTRPNLNRNDTIFFVGTVRAQLTAPLLGLDGTALTGVQIIGCANGMVRDDDGAKWTYPASGAVAGGDLLVVRQQGWSTKNFLMTPEPGGTGGACVRINRAEDATNPDGSHFIADTMKFVGIDVTTTYGIRDVGGSHNNLITNCQFLLLTTGIYNSSTSVAVPLRWQILNNTFRQNTNDIICPASYFLIQGNRFFSTAATEKVEISGGGFNVVTGNVFPNAIADIDPAGGYDGNATDTWTGNLVSDQAAFAYGDPA